MVEEPLIDCDPDPLKVTAPLLLLNVPLFVKFPDTPNTPLLGAVRVDVMLMLASVVADDPDIVVVPLNTTVPLFAPNVPLLVQFPATFIVPDGAVSVPLIMILLSELVLLPEIAVVPPKVAVPEPALSVPLLTRLPFTLKLEVGVRVPVIVTPPKVSVVPPLSVVAPEKVIALAVKTEPELLTRFPCKFSVCPFESNVPALKVSTPLITPAPSKVFVFDPEMVTVLNV